MSATQPPPSPTHILRAHTTSIVVLRVSKDNEIILSGDTSGLVVITSTRTLRPVASWKPHISALLGLEEWGKRVITQGRDNKLHVWARVDHLPSPVRPGGSAVIIDTPEPKLEYSLDVNALNFCRFSFLPSKESDDRGLIALPNLIDSDVADIWALQKQPDRIHAAVGQLDGPPPQDVATGIRGKTGIIMGLHIFTSGCDLKLLAAYEDGSVVLRRYATHDHPRSMQGTGWETIWKAKLHNESIMAMGVSPDSKLAFTVSADQLIGRYELLQDDQLVERTCVAHRTKRPGNASICIRGDGKVCAVGGWDGKIRLYGTKNMKSLGTLTYHKTSISALDFAKTEQLKKVNRMVVSSDSEDDFTEAERENRSRWLVAGSADNKITIWSLMDFGRQ